jgi:predicted RNase H-like nuclease (RuvC/YqgF family)
VSLVKIVQLLALALNPATLKHESDAAIRKAELLSRDDGTVASLLDSVHKLKVAKAETERDLAQCRSTIDALQAQNHSLQSEGERLQAEVNGLKAEVHALKEVVSDDARAYVNFADFARRAGQSYARKLWKSAFAFEAAITIKEMNAWETVGLAPAVWLAKLDALTEEQRKPTARKPWTAKERARLQAILDQGHTDLATARILTGEFGRRIYESSITTQRRQLFRQEGWAPQCRPSAGRRRGQTKPLH